ncbi:MAG TPA: lysylphosphatidylglycerol synthase transmembrane domain-containing protein [Chitinophagaceae bacterium]|nr:lysylphosphatidylglycerol synthase transmembrane domain-containing protein [Chitinophagaceae bacterium]
MLSKSTKIIINYVFGIGLFIWLSYSIYHQLRYKDNIHLSVQQLKESIRAHQPAMMAVIVMMVVNWGLEAWKWQILVRPLQRISFRRSFYAILLGVSFSVNTPNRIGEYGGRILYLKNNARLSGVMATMVGSFSQFITTLLFGIAGLLFYIWHFTPFTSSPVFTPYTWEMILLFGVLAVTATVMVLYYRLYLIVWLFDRIRWLRRFRKFVEVINQFSGRFLSKILLLSILRYMVFSAQYLILLKVMGVDMVWWQGFLMIFLMYLIMAILPTIAIAELGIRGEIGLFLFGLISVNKIGIIAGTIGIWLINLVIPAILGSLLLLGIKVLNEEKITGILKKQRA